MNTFFLVLRTLFYPLPSRAEYLSSHLLPFLVVSVGLIVASLAIKFWRGQMQGASLKKLSKSWPTACLWFGLTGLILIVARAEGIQYVAMRFWWIVWGLAGLFYLYVQFRLFRARHYEIIPAKKIIDPRDEYLPKAKRK